MAARTIPELTESDKQRFWERVNKDGPIIKPKLGPCWIWTRAKTSAGYGHFCMRGTVFIASRVAWAIEHGGMADELQALHSCDNPSCVRPSHLFIGTRFDNMRDMASKGARPIYGASRNTSQGGQHLAKLTDVRVSEIRRLASIGVSNTKISKMFGVTVANIGTS